MAMITRLEAREILDSRGNPTVEVYIQLSDNTEAIASVPSGASTGSHEALELRDNDPKRYQGKGVLQAVAHVNGVIAESLVKSEIPDQRTLDNRLIELDGTENKSKLGANALLGVSLAFARACAKSQQQSLYQYLGTLASFEKKEGAFPIPMFNVINGGEHADSGLSIQEFKIVPSGIVGYHEQLRAGSEVFHTLQSLLKRSGYSTDVGDEGGFAPKLGSHSECFELLVQAIQESGYDERKEWQPCL